MSQMHTDRTVVTGSKLYINMNTGDILKTVTDVNIVQTTPIMIHGLYRSLLFDNLEWLSKSLINNCKSFKCDSSYS